jgi:hypothetical protein
MTASDAGRSLREGSRRSGTLMSILSSPRNLPRPTKVAVARSVWRPPVRRFGPAGAPPGGLSLTSRNCWSSHRCRPQTLSPHAVARLRTAPGTA